MEVVMRTFYKNIFGEQIITVEVLIDDELVYENNYGVFDLLNRTRDKAMREIEYIQTKICGLYGAYDTIEPLNVEQKRDAISRKIGLIYRKTILPTVITRPILIV